MNQPCHTDRPCSPLSLDQLIEKACGPFEAALEATPAVGQTPRVEDYVSAVVGRERAWVLRELVLLEVHYRRRRGESPPTSEYRARFPELDPEWLTNILTPAAATKLSPPAAHVRDAPAQGIRAAQQKWMHRYYRAVHRYLRGALRDADAADELAREFAVRFLRGDFRGADPQRGRFRDFLNEVLFRLIRDYHRRQRTLARPLRANGADQAASSAGSPERDRQFLESWREDLLARTWEALAQIEKETGTLFHRIMRFRIQHPELRSSQMAEQLSAELGQPLRADWVRQTLHRGREKFADLLLAEVADTLQNPSADELEEELTALGLRSYCQTALKRYRGKN